MTDPNLGRCPNCERLEKELEALKQKYAVLEQQVVELKGYVFGRHKRPEHPAQKPGAKEGHKGWFRSKPPARDITRTEEVLPTVCPICKKSDALSATAEIEEHVQEDLVLPEPQVTLYRKHVYWCRRCGKKVRGQGKDELPSSPIGPVAKSVADFLRYKVKVTQRDIAKIFKGLFKFSVSMASVQNFHTQTRQKAQVLHDQIQEQLKKEPAIHADETGAPINGANGWTWLFASERIAFYHTVMSRGGGVVQKVLGKTYDGILSTDFYSAYNRSITAMAKQKCLVHLDRDLKKLLTTFSKDHPVFFWAERLRAFLQEARAFYDAWHAGKLTGEQLTEAADRFRKELPSFIQLQASESDIRRLSKRLLRHQHELLTFLTYPDRVSPDNNYAERLIRPCVIFRKLTGGFRSKTGTDNHNVLMSLAQTAHLNGKDPLTLFHNILTQPETSLDWCLSP